MPPTILAGALPGGVNIFSSPPPNPGINDPCMPKPPSFPPIPIRRRNPTPNNTPTGSNKPNPNPALKSTHRRTKYYKPVTDDVIQADGDRAVVISDSGVSYLLPGAPFEFQFSYSETPKVKPIAFREPAFLPFGPPTMSRPWTGKAPLKSKKEKELKRQKRVRLVPSSQSEEKEESEKKMVMETSRQITGNYRMHRRSREEILGKPLSKSEIRALVKPCLSRNRQVNLGRDGLIHNMLELIHSHWRRHEICKVRCRGVPTLDMDNVCHHLEEKTRGKIIHRVGGVIYLYRGRNYDPLNRPRYPVMLWKPAAPVYPKLIQEAPVGLTKVEADKLRNDGKKLLPICKLAKNGIYVDLVQNVRDAFEGSSLVKINCKGLEPSDYKKIGAKLKDLVPCVLMSFDDEQILIWRGNDWKSTTPSPSLISNRKISGTGNAGKLRVLWKSAIDAKKALLLDDESVAVSPDLLLEKVEQFESVSQATAHSYTARILVEKKENNFSSEDDEFLLVEEEKTKIPFGSLGVDQITRQS